MPSPNDLEVSEAAGSDSNVSRPDFTDSGITSRKLPASGGGEQKEPQIETPTAISGLGVAGHSMSVLFAQLWNIQPKGTTVELHLRDGEVVVPDQFLKKLSDQSHHGVFAVKEADGSVSLVVVAWDAIARATLRGLSELPKELAE